MSERPIFVLGCPRSGTTLLQLMLHAHPGIAIPPENRFVLPVYYGRKTFGDLQEATNRRKLAEQITAKGTKFKDLKLDKEDIHRRIVDGPPSVGSAIGIVLGAYAERFGKPRWGDKRPAYYRHIPAIRRMFPDAQIIHLVRDPRACVASLNRMPWWSHDTPTGCATWADSIDMTLTAARRLPADSFHQLRYEDLTADPETRLQEICRFLGEDYDPAMAQPYKIADDAVPGYKRWHSGTRGEVSSAAVDKWRTELTPEEIGLIETVLRGRMKAIGYEPSGARRPPLRLLRRYAQVRVRRRISARKQTTLEARRRLTDRNQVADQVRLARPAEGSAETRTSAARRTE